MKKKKEVKRYEIDSFEKLCNVINEDNFKSLTTDLLMWLCYQVKFMKDIRENTPKKFTKDKTNWDLGKSTFVWIDDGKHEMKEIIIRNGLTGEVKTFELKNNLSGKELTNEK